MRISKRLEAVASFVSNNEVVLDVGTDHGLLMIYLIKNKIIERGYASDLREGPLKSAQQNVELFGLNNKIQLLLSDGLNKMSDDVTTIIIAGMGGELISKILSNDLDKIKDKTLILQPNTQVPNLREFIMNNNLKIIDEEIIFEDGHYYEIMKVVKGQEKLSKEEIYFGPILLKKKSEIFIQKYESEYKKYINILTKLDDKHDTRKKKIIKHIKMIEVFL
ncbi:TPA: SAM-dependent methyltransferase [bacterium]|nr:SAM-dependent methyltransferase [bacterium]